MLRFQNSECYFEHFKIACKYYHQCLKCHHVYNVKSRQEHICG